MAKCAMISVIGFILNYLLDAVGSSGILKVKQKLGVNFNFDKQDVIDFTIFKNDNVQGLRSKYKGPIQKLKRVNCSLRKKVVLTPLLIKEKQEEK